MVKIVKITAKLSLLIYFGRGCGIVCVYNMGPSKNDVIADSWACPKDCFVAILTFIWQKGNLWVRINYYSFKWGGVCPNGYNITNMCVCFKIATNKRGAPNELGPKM